MAPLDTAGETALVVIAVAVSVQTFVMIAVTVGLVAAWRRTQGELDVRYRELVTRLDAVAGPVRRAADAMAQASTHASNTLSRAEDVATTVGTVLAVPRSLFAAGAATIAGMVLSKWRRGRGRPSSPQPHVSERVRDIH